MKGLAELVVSLCDLCEAEGRLLEAGILRTVRRVGLLSLGLLFGAAALALLLAALYALLTSLLPAPAALALLGGVSAGVAAGLLWGARGRRAPDGGDGMRAEAPEEERAAPGAIAEAPAKTRPGSHDTWAEVAPYGHRSVTGSGKPAGRKDPAHGLPHPRMQGNR